MFGVRVHLTHTCLAALDLAVTTACLLGLRRLETGSTPEDVGLLVPVLALWFALSAWFGMYRSRRLDSPLADLAIIFRIGLTSWILGQVVSGVLPGLALDRLLTLRFVAANFLALTAVRSVLRVSLRELRRRGHDVKRVLLVASEELGDRLEYRIKRRSHYGYRVAARFGCAECAHDGGRGLVERVRECLQSGQIDDVILALPLQASELSARLVAECESQGVNVRIVPDLFPLIRTDTQIYDLDGIPLVNARLYPTEYFGYVVVKRAFDLCFSLSVLTLLSPLFLVLSLLVKLTSPGSVFFTQDRVGMNGKRFRIIKFRTMRQTSSLDPDSHWTAENDGYVTPLGGWLRRTNLDELPQFLNVLKGEMSVVGPRPERPFFLDRFRQEVPEYMARHYVKSGITGWAQVHGWRGDTAIPERVAHDLYYIRNWAVSLDIIIVFLTLTRAFFPGLSVPGDRKSGGLIGP